METTRAPALPLRKANAMQIAASATTGLFAAIMAISGVLYVVGPAPIVAGIRELGYPDYFRQLLGLAKIAGAAALVMRGPRTLREWAYAGFTFELIAAIVSHALRGPFALAAPAVFALALLLASYSLRRRTQAFASNAARR